jgi:hypothetical protein
VLTEAKMRIGLVAYLGKLERGNFVHCGVWSGEKEEGEECTGLTASTI